MESSSNPVLQDNVVKRVRDGVTKTDTMTIGGTLVKIGLLLALLVGVGAWSWGYTEANPDSAGWLTFGASITGFIVAMIVIFTKPNPFLIMIYTALQGVVIGSISFLFEGDFQGIVQQAILITVSITIGMLLLFATGLVSVTDKLRSVIIIATFGVAIFYLLSFLIGLFSESYTEFAFSGTSGVVIALIIVFIAALNLLLDFDFISKGARQGLPKQFEWYAAFGIMITLIWLYFSILRLLAVSRN